MNETKVFGDNNLKALLKATFDNAEFLGKEPLG
jgi:hypothetical protein